MNTKIGLWVDHRKAVIVNFTKEGENIQKIESGTGRRVRYRGTSNTKSPFSSQYQQGDDQLDNKFTEQLNKFYDEVINQIRAAEAILIFGPGEAKGELKKRLEHQGLSAQIVAVETEDKMTDRQITAKVRERFLV
jgi:stalled ribosome rescue protein Dom34